MSPSQSKEITPAHVTHVTPLTNRLLHVTLTPEHYIPYEAGQYLQIMSSTDTPYYSIANAPLGSKTYELHIRHNPANPEHQHMLEAITQQSCLVLNLPFGTCTLRALNPDKPILFIAAGTGFAPINAMIEQHLTDGSTQPFELYWSARAQEELYLDEKVLAWEKHVPHFHYTPHITGEHQPTFIERILKHPNLANHQLVLAGPTDLIYTLRDNLLANGLTSEQLFSDAFSLNL